MKINTDIEILKGDCLRLLEKIPEKSIDMILCDLPYGTTKNKWDSIIDLTKLWDRYARIVKKNGAIVLTSQGIFTAKLIISNEKWFKYKIVWEKSKPTNFLNAKKQPLRKHEDICVFYQSQPTYNPQMTFGKPYSKGVRKNQHTGSYGEFNPILVESKDGLRYPTDAVYFKTPESEPEGTVWHPTQKPVALCEYLIRTYTTENMLVLDNCMGSGTTGVACINTGRRFIGMELDESYFSMTKERLENAVKEKEYNLFYEYGEASNE